MGLDFTNDPHRRHNPLTDEWVLCSPHRTKRPWQGAQEKTAPEVKPAYDPKCYLCPGNERMGGERNPDYAHTYVFPNDFPALLTDSSTDAAGEGLLRAQGVRGEARVICFSPRHDLTLAQMSPEDIRRVVDVWGEQITDLGGRYRWVQLFENKGQAMGASNPHPHGQLWACDFLPTLPAKEDAAQRAYYEKTGRPMLTDVLEQETAAGERIVARNAHWTLLVPFWAVWPFEYLLLPNVSVARLPDLSGEQRDALASILKDGLGRYDRLFDTSFPYSMGWHGAPTGPDAADAPWWTLHAHFYPPLLRSATVRKFMVGFELLAEAQRDITPEQAAARLREV